MRVSPRRWIAALSLVLGGAIAIVATRSGLPSLANRTASTVAPNTEETHLGRAIVPMVAQHPGLSGIYPLRDARDAFGARFGLAATAERTLDVQYYIWRNDLSGTLLFEALRDAADRGVRVRLLLDDNNTSGLDRVLAALDAHPRIEVRVFNPFVFRRARIFDYLLHFSRVNRRMHNKSFIADNQAAIIGGRNVGDEYFGATHGELFADADVIAIGPVVNDTSAAFDRYWASASSYPFDSLVAPASESQIEVVKKAFASVERDPRAVAYLNAIRSSPFVRDLMAHTLPAEWATAHVICDDPGKALGRSRHEDLLVEKMRMIFGTPLTRLDLISPYLVPDDDGTRLLAGWAQHGVKIRLLTNALEATDVAAVHAGYAKRRKALLQAGIVLYELRRTPGEQRGGGDGMLGSSSVSLHAKSFAVDESRVFIGSFNFDPRSTRLNTEMGFVIDSAVLAGKIKDIFDRAVPVNAYEVRLSSSGDLYWLERSASSARRLEAEPGAGFWLSAWLALLSRLPIEWLL